MVVHLGTNDEDKSLIDLRTSVIAFITEVRSVLDRASIVFSDVQPRCRYYRKDNDHVRSTAFNARMDDFNEAIAQVSKETRRRASVVRHTYANPDDQDLNFDYVHLSPRGARLLARESECKIGRLLNELGLYEKFPGPPKSRRSLMSIFKLETVGYTFKSIRHSLGSTGHYSLT